MSDHLYKTVRIVAVALVEHDGEWWILGYADDWTVLNDYRYIIAIKNTHEEAVESLNHYQERIHSHKTFPRGVRRHLFEYLLP